MEDIIKTQEEYIDFLEDNIVGNAGYLFAHGMQASREDVDKGKLLRDKIKNAKENYKLDTLKQ